MIAKIEPWRTEKLRSRWMTRVAERDRQISRLKPLFALACGAMASNPERIGADRENRVERDDADDSGHDRGGRGAAHIRGAASGSQPDMTARQCDEGAEDDALDQSDRELRCRRRRREVARESSRRSGPGLRC